jgi:hypothetical protein
MSDLFISTKISSLLPTFRPAGTFAGYRASLFQCCFAGGCNEESRIFRAAFFYIMACFVRLYQIDAQSESSHFVQQHVE